MLFPTRQLAEDFRVLSSGPRSELLDAKLSGPHFAFSLEGPEFVPASMRKAALRAFNKAVLAVPEVEQCHMIASRFDYLLKVRTGDIADYRRVLAERISALPHVASTSTYVAMEAVKETP